MPSLKEVRIRIASVKSTQQITSAMKMVSASKLRRAQNAILKMRPYASKLKEILQNLSASIGSSDQSPFTEQRSPEKVLLVVLSSNGGLCGAFNSNIIKSAVSRIDQKWRSQDASGNLAIMTIGRKATEFFRKKGFNVVASHDGIYETLTWENVTIIAENLMKDFSHHTYDRIEIIYNQFKNAAIQVIKVEQFLPVEPPEAEASSKLQSDYIFEPSKEEIVRELIPKSLKIQFYKALLDSFASEHGARMTAMHQATDNATELLKQLNLIYNKARQASITNEILEIVSGAEAQKG
ncbi:MAG TPA: ATP synthase F1 subunit gamma [Bacteroidales bacterium]|nr:ATP synthase F1 subunit gamma [Bacteroidales bacterium]HPT03227.1 ATP synthase F1 subunit gamma [Bacteroidales bacterium]